MKKEYPKFKYHAEKAPVIVHSAEEDVALGSDWAESPAEFAEKVKELPQKPEAPEAPAEEPLPAAAKKRGRKPRAA